MSLIDPRAGALPGVPPLGAFERTAQAGEPVQVILDGEQYAVLAQGQMASAEGTGRQVAWVQGGTDTTAMFIQALAQSFGGGISSAVAREFGLEPAPGLPLAAHTVTQAIAAARTGQQALAGVDFLTALEHSATAGGPAFRAVAAQTGMAAGDLSSDDLRLIDEAMQSRFAQAAASGHSPVSSQTCAGWLKDELSRLTKANG